LIADGGLNMPMRRATLRKDMGPARGQIEQLNETSSKERNNR